MTNDSVGLVGAGNVGTYFVEWLTTARHSVTVHDVDPERVDHATDLGATAAGSPAEVVRESTVVLLSLPGSEYVEAVMEGEDGILTALEAGQVVVDTGTTEPDVEVRYERLCREREAAYLDAPLTWGGPGEYTDESGPAFTMFVGGDPDTYERVEPILDTLAHTHEHFGPVGHGQVVKAGHRLRQNCMAALDAELVEFYRNNGVDAEAVDDLLGWGVREALFDDAYEDAPGFDRAMTEAGGSDGAAVADARDEGGDFRIEERAGGERLRTTSFNKDMAYALAIARSSETVTPIASAAFQVYQAAEAYGTAVRDRDLAFQDPEWTDREDVVHEYRRRNRPVAEWRRLRRASDATGDAADPRSGDEHDSEGGGSDRA